MNFCKSILIASLLILTHSAFAQRNYQQDYLNAKLLFKEGKYALAMEAFKSLIPKEEANYFSEYSSFYYALSAYYQEYPAVAKDMLLQLKQFYPKWSRMDEVNFWLGKIYLENDEFDRGMNVLNAIRKSSFKEDISNLKYFSYSTVGDLDKLKEIYANNKPEKELAEVLAERLASGALTMQNRELLDELIKKFDLNPADYNLLEMSKPVFKDSYKVAVLLPFMISDLDINKKPKRNQFVLNMYHGIRQAYDSLKNAGYNMELFTYDTKRDTSQTRKILEKEELKGMDVIIGPLWTKSVEMVNNFSLKHKINVINPFWTNSSFTAVNPFSFLYSPCNETIATEAADYALKNVSEKPGIIFYGESRGDSIKAYSYKQRMEQDSFKIIMTRKIPHDRTEDILDILLLKNTRLRDASTEEAKEKYGIKMDSVGHIFVASDHDLISSKVLSAVVVRGDSIKVIGSGNWLGSSSSTNYERYNDLGVTLYAPSYKPKNTSSYQNFRRTYAKKHKRTPDSDAENGYEVMMMVGNALKNYGKYFQIGWNKEEFIEGYLSVGYRYKYANDNKIVPMLSFEDDGLKVYYPTQFDKNGDKKK